MKYKHIKDKTLRKLMFKEIREAKKGLNGHEMTETEKSYYDGVMFGIESGIWAVQKAIEQGHIQITEK